MELVQYIGSIGGIAGVLAFLIFMAYRHLVNQMREDRKFMEDRLSKMIDAYNQASADNTRVLTELITWLRVKNGNR